MDVAAKLHMAFLDHLNVYVNRTASRINSMFICIKKSQNISCGKDYETTATKRIRVYLSNYAGKQGYLSYCIFINQSLPRFRFRSHFQTLPTTLHTLMTKLILALLPILYPLKIQQHLLILHAIL
jgi:hypothetical protein